MLWLNYSKKSRCFLKIWVSTEKTFILKRTARSGAVQFVVWLDSWQAGDASLGCLSLSLIRWSIPVPIVSPSFFTPGGQPREDSLNFPAIFTHNAVFFFFLGHLLWLHISPWPGLHPKRGPTKLRVFPPWLWRFVTARGGTECTAEADQRRVCCGANEGMNRGGLTRQTVCQLLSRGSWLTTARQQFSRFPVDKTKKSGLKPRYKTFRYRCKGCHCDFRRRGERRPLMKEQGNTSTCFLSTPICKLARFYQLKALSRII